MKLVLHGRAGRQKKAILWQRIPVVVEELGVATPERVRQHYHEKFGEPVGWHTVARYLRSLSYQGLLHEQVVTSGKGRNTVVYRLKNS